MSLEELERQLASAIQADDVARTACREARAVYQAAQAAEHKALSALWAAERATEVTDRTRVRIVEAIKAAREAARGKGA